MLTPLYKATNDTGMKLFASILKEHGAVNSGKYTKKDIFNNNLLAASNDPYTRFKANEENNKEFLKILNTLNVFGQNGLNDLIKK